MNEQRFNVDDFVSAFLIFNGAIIESLDKRTQQAVASNLQRHLGRLQAGKAIPSSSEFLGSQEKIERLLEIFLEKVVHEWSKP